jgi:hypothetical protein
MLHGTRDLPLTLGADNTGIVKWYIDASFAVLPNMRGHTGGAVSLGRGFPIVSSTKQKLNTRSSTKAELVGVDNLMLAILWTQYFLKAQSTKWRIISCTKIPRVVFSWLRMVKF